MTKSGRAYSLVQVVREIPLPTIAFDLESRRILAANDRALHAFSWSLEKLQKMEVADLWQTQDVPAAISSIAMVTSGDVESYQAIRHLRGGDHAHAEVNIRIRKITLGDENFGLLSFEVNQMPGDEVPNSTSLTIALIVTDHQWIIEHISSDIELIVGEPPHAFIGTPLLDWIKPTEVARFASTIGRIAAHGGGGTVQTVMQSRSGSLHPIWTLVIPLSDQSPPRLGVVLTGCPTVGAELSFEIDRQLSRCVEVVADLGDLNLRVVSANLSTRQLEILAELLQGHRVKEIADKFFLSQSTVRNHLTDIFKKVGVHSQTELLAKFVAPLSAGSESEFA